MKCLQLLAWIVLGTLVAKADSPHEFHVRGTVRSILSPEELVIAHEDIPGFMPAMTMAFQLAEPSEASQVRIDDQVEGVLVVNEQSMFLKDLSVVGQEGRAASAATNSPGKVIRLREGDVAPAFALKDQDNHARSVTTAESYTLLTFIFTRCPVPDYCPLMSSRFAAVQRAIQSGKTTQPLHLLSVTIDPEFDTPEQLAAYAGAMGANPELWTHACATPEETGRMVRAFRVFRERNGALLDHTLCTALIDPNGKLVKVWRGNQWLPDEVIATVNSASTETLASR